MKYALTDVAGYVYALLDENREILEERVEYADPGVNLEPLITALLPEAARNVLMEASPDSFDECRELSGSQAGSPKQISTCANMATVSYRLPDDFLRLLYCRMSDWEEGVRIPLEYGSDAHRLRGRRYGSFSFACRRPAVAVKRRGKIADLLVYGTRQDSELAELCYVPRPVVIDGEIDLPPALLHDVCERTASMVRNILGDLNRR